MAKWTLDLSRYGAKTKDQISKVFRETGIDLTTRIIFRTPILSGMLRGNWFCSFAQTSRTTKSVDKGGGATVARANRVIADWDVFSGQSLFITNNLPYAEGIEDGRSKTKAPAGMVKVSMLEIGGIVEGAARNERT